MAKNLERLLVFGDETYPDGTDSGRIVYIALAVALSDLERRHAAIRSIAGLRRSRKLAALRDFLNDRVFLISLSTIDRTAVRGSFLKRRESYPDVGTISSTDDFWTQGFGYSLAVMFRFISDFWPIWPIKIYYDERKISERLQESTEKSILSILPTLAEETLQEMGRESSLTIESVEQVTKPTKGKPYRLQDDGLWLADAIGQLIKEFPREALSPNFLFCDHTDVAVEIETEKEGTGGYNPTPPADA